MTLLGLGLTLNETTPSSPASGDVSDKFILKSDPEFLDAYFRLVAPRRRNFVVRFDPLGRARIRMYGTWADLPANRGAKKAKSKIGRIGFRSIRASSRARCNSTSHPGVRPAE